MYIVKERVTDLLKMKLRVIRRGKREEGINYSGLQAADQGCRHYCFRMSQMKFR